MNTVRLPSGQFMCWCGLLHTLSEDAERCEHQTAPYVPGERAIRQNVNTPRVDMPDPWAPTVYGPRRRLGRVLVAIGMVLLMLAALVAFGLASASAHPYVPPATPPTTYGPPPARGRRRGRICTGKTLGDGVPVVCGTAAVHGQHRVGSPAPVPVPAAAPARLVDGRALALCRRTWRRWWLGIVGVDAVEQITTEQCLLPRGTASDDGWLRVDPEPWHPYEQSDPEVGGCDHCGQGRRLHP